MNWFHTMRLPCPPTQAVGDPSCVRNNQVILSSLSVLLLAITLVGCSNSVQVVRSNVERTVQNKGKREAPAYPAHPYARTASVSEVDRTNNERPSDEPDEADEEEIIQAAAQQRPNGNYPGRAPPSPSGSVAITGRVVDSSGRPQAFVSIIAAPTRRPGGTRTEAMTDRQGHFHLRGLEPGQRYLILATATRSQVALIGRVAAVAPQQGITIGISRPNTADRQAEPQLTRREPQDHVGSATRAPATENSSGSRFHGANPFAPSGNSKEAPPAIPSRTMSRQTREQAVASNRLDSPWDMPAPSKSTAKASTKSASTTQTPTTPRTDDRAGSSTGWRQAGSAASQPKRPSSAGGFSQLDSAPTGPQPHRTPRGGIEPDDPPESSQSQSISGAARPPIDVEADANPDRPKAAVTKAHVPVEPTLEPRGRSQDHAVQFHERPMCQMDGKRLVDFQLNDVDGRPVSFQSIDSELVLIDFWWTHCSPCIKAMPHLAKLQKRYGPQGLQIVGIACEQGDLADRRSRVAKIRNQLQIPYPLLIDEGDDNLLVRDNFRVISYPTLVLLDKSGKVLWRSETAEPQDLVRLENLLKSQLNSTASRYN